MNSHHKLILIFSIWLIAAGCMCVPGSLPKIAKPGALANKTPTQTFQQEASNINQQDEPEEIEETEETDIPAAPSQSENGLNTQAPWLIISSENGIWAANPDGSGLQKIVENAIYSKLADVIQPGGNRMAVITADSDQIHNMALHLVSLPDGNMEKITDLTSPETESSADANPGEPEFEAIIAVNRAGLAWSPDGKKLAFIGLMDGPRADLYLYDVDSETITRVTEDIAQTFNPAWTPDGENILLFGAESFGTGAGLTMTGVWSFRKDGSNITMLYEPKNSAGEILLGWRGNSTAILSSWGAMCGENQLRLYDITNAKTTMIHKECAKAAASPKGTILYGDDNALYLVGPESKSGKQVYEGETTYVKWDPASEIFIAGFRNGKLLTFDALGKNQTETPEDFVLNVATRNGVWAWTSYNQSYPGVIVSGPGMETGQIFTENADFPIFDENKNLLFFANNQIFRSTPPLYEFSDPVAEINENVQEVIWMQEK